MSVRLTDDEAWAVLAASHTGILTTLRADGRPVALPVWFVVLERTICLAAPTRTKKVARARHDSRASFLVEHGKRWAELQAVHVSGSLAVVDDEAAMATIDGALGDKYATFRTEPELMPDATRRRYAGRTFLRLEPEGRLLTWDNRRIELGKKT